MATRPTTQLLAVRIPTKLSERVDNFLDSQRGIIAGVRITRSDAVRMLLERALAGELIAAPDSVAA